MKRNRTKAFRISKGESKLKRKIQLMYNSGYCNYNDDYSLKIKYSDFLKDVLEGKKCTWIRTINTKCSCYCCSGIYKYKRNQNENTKSILNEDDE